MKYDKEFKQQALQLSDEIGVKVAAEKLRIKYYTLADWRKIRKLQGTASFVGSGHKVISKAAAAAFQYKFIAFFRG